MQNLFITKNLKIVREAKMLKIEGEKLRKIPVNLINGVYLFGNVELTNGARNLLLDYSKDIYLFNSKGEFKGVVTNSKLKSNYRYRLLQYKNIDNLEIAKFIVLKKIEEIEKYTKKSLNRYKEKLKTTTNLNEVLGVEGSSSIYLFNKVREKLNDVGIKFEKREYRPAKDRVNSVLSFVYKLHYGILHTIILNEGFDVYIGFLHKKRGTHMAFVSDVMEGYRVILTAFVVTLFINKKLSDEDFNGIYLNYEGRKKFLRYYLDLIEEMDNNSFLEEIKRKLESF